ncbi:bifunctional folylpolyglutamate synthase/dihydrofolate synthase [Telmatocola sphagniphila]|uniref:Dihydrofolate synthase/folylpolyglutamate synthase n=1 Tax=Telmatocola sphagniphila TaxID=1123043 RepID=A0A8E6B4E9_9BACT|nr:folylpolyglutamate synthase/dihydrofolate synthase family protein [Telmatocola sphagniphila]QVL31965.1 bifunctional folylpolyglutamate synthase/dihydrofolate synthase [Telmatocola sphagniphila]
MLTPEDALNYWYGRIDFEKRAAQPGELKLDRMRQLLRHLGDPDRHLRIVHVAGTKGKGSTCAMLASILQAAGYRVGLFTSPHLEDVSERIQVNGVPISREEMLARLREIEKCEKKISAPTGQKATFFEIGTALGFAHFDCRRVDVALIEVGLGGRFDSTNVVKPKLCVITNISYDHMNILGNTLTQIAYEKGGIIKSGVPVVVTAQAPEAVAVFRQLAQCRKSPLLLAGVDFPTTVDFPVSLPGAHQEVNAAGAVAAVQQLRRQGLTIPDSAVRYGLANTSWPARIQIVHQQPRVILDCAHNVASVQALVQTLRQEVKNPGPKILIAAISSDKQVAETLTVLAEYFDIFYLTKYLNNPRSTPPEELARMVKKAKPEADICLFSQASEAWAAAWERADTETTIVVTGSVFLAGELRGIIEKTVQQP